MKIYILRHCTLNEKNLRSKIFKTKKEALNCLCLWAEYGIWKLFVKKNNNEPNLLFSIELYGEEQPPYFMTKKFNTVMVEKKYENDNQ